MGTLRSGFIGKDGGMQDENWHSICALGPLQVMCYRE